MSYAVRVEQVTGTPLAVVKRKVAAAQLPRVVPEACGIVWNALKSAGIKGGRHVSVYWGAAGGLIECEIGAEVGGPFEAVGEVVASATPAGEAATVTHLGPYGGLGKAHQAVKDWAAASGRAFAGPSWEVYGHWLTEWNEHPERIRTDIFYLLKR